MKIRFKRLNLKSSGKTASLQIGIDSRSRIPATIGSDTDPCGFVDGNTRIPSLDSLIALVEFSKDAIFTRTFDGTITTWNPAAERIFGYSRDEIINNSSDVLVPQEHRDELRKLVSKIRSGSVVQGYETERTRKDGERVLLSLTFAPIQDRVNQRSGFLTVARDITEHGRDLARRERELETMFDQASVGLIVLDGNGEVLRANRAFLKLLECAARQIIGLPLKEFYSQSAESESLLNRLTKRKALHNIPMEFRTWKGRTRFALVDANTVWQDGKLVCSRWIGARKLDRAPQKIQRDRSDLHGTPSYGRQIKIKRARIARSNFHDGIEGAKRRIGSEASFDRR